MFHLYVLKKNFLETWALRQIEFDIPVWLAWYNIFLYHVSCALSGFWEFCTIWKFIHHNDFIRHYNVGMSFVFGTDRNWSISILRSSSPGTQPAMITAAKPFHNSTKNCPKLLSCWWKTFKSWSFYSNKLFQWDVIRSKLVHLFV